MVNMMQASPAYHRVRVGGPYPWLIAYLPRKQPAPSHEKTTTETTTTETTEKTEN